MPDKEYISLTLISPNGQKRGKEVYFSKRQVLIGRGDDCDIRPACFEVSRRHCQINVTDNGIWLRDLSSANGTFVSGEKIEAPYPLKTGDVVQVGTMHLEVKVPDSEPLPSESVLDEGGVLQWAKSPVEEFTAAGQTTLRKAGDSGDSLELELTRAIGNAIDDFVTAHPNLTPEQIRMVLKQLFDALDDQTSSLIAQNPLHVPPSRLLDVWPSLSEDTKNAVMAIVDNAMVRKDKALRTNY